MTPPTTTTTATTPVCAEAWRGSRVPAPRRSRRRQLMELCSLCASEVQLPRKSGLKGSLGAAHCCFLRSFLMGDGRVPLREETGRQPPRQSIGEKAKMNGFPIQTLGRLQEGCNPRCWTWERTHKARCHLIASEPHLSAATFTFPGFKQPSITIYFPADVPESPRRHFLQSPSQKRHKVWFHV